MENNKELIVTIEVPQQTLRIVKPLLDPNVNEFLRPDEVEFLDKLMIEERLASTVLRHITYEIKKVEENV